MVHRQAVRVRLRPERPWREQERLYIDLFADPRVAAALWPGALGGPRTAEQAAKMLSADIAHWLEERFGLWAFFEASTGVFVGRGGLRRAMLAGDECVEVLYAVRSDAWGRGYASEIAQVTVAHARRLGLTSLVGLVSTVNAPSRRVLEKAGLRFDGSLVDRAGIPHWLGRLSPDR